MTTDRHVSRRSPMTRDMDETPFTPILRELVRCIPGAVGAVLVDDLGETVDYFGHADPFDLKVTAAHWQIVLVELATLVAIQTRQITIRSAKRSYIVRRLPENYALVILLSKRAGFTSTTRALEACESALATEASWPKTTKHHWVAVEVAVDPKRRPREITLRKAKQSLEVLGTLMGLRAREKGFRVRLETGAELNLVREPGGRWYADES
jgi:hypothetical protein